ncbi:hypothetical protein [Nitrosopumilus sp.]|uniref:hypothetical protein n=1 Tax=Nitrosopumilus sp. TaxID=2024843 RepID=UPI00292E6AA8|nr:hypothetical protein [Nitrosopumilus sp.]
MATSKKSNIKKLNTKKRAKKKKITLRKKRPLSSSRPKPKRLPPLNKRKLTKSQREIIEKVVDVMIKTRLVRSSLSGSCYWKKDCTKQMGKGRISRQECKDLGGKSWKETVTGNCVNF